jgi:hypothetical protein
MALLQAATALLNQLCGPMNLKSMPSICATLKTGAVFASLPADSLSFVYIGSRPASNLLNAAVKYAGIASCLFDSRN